ncbi:hypothetical protein PJF56_13735 [Roseofilum sp. BLCC_M91]|uniref:ATPase involved in DNA repair n=1 Tax=Roseofilum halophilum BLCC-M91 TaxID=3022259 RepID=A0ABT7BL51_9CYAN|nr:hypothetical protein [Roseofilum halophilum]MDJ1179925.1 hypothetical protein [Roseofilum halophilum BLCC-M91]
MEQIYTTIFELLWQQLQKSTQAGEQNSQQVAHRIAGEVTRICVESQRIQASGEVEGWARKLAQLRLKQCLHYYQQGSVKGRRDLHSTLAAIVYGYINPSYRSASYAARTTLIEDFLQAFYLEAFNAFRRETELPFTYHPKTRLDIAEFMAFAERYGKRRIRLRGNRSQQLIILRAQTFSQQQPPEDLVDIESASEAGSADPDSQRSSPGLAQVRKAISNQEQIPEVNEITEKVTQMLLAYLEERGQQQCADYFVFRLLDLATSQIEWILEITPRERDYLQQRFKYHLERFALGPHWELVHEWLEAGLEQNLGLMPQEWETFTEQLSEEQQQHLNLRQNNLNDEAIADRLGCTLTQVQKRWIKILAQAWAIRNA